MAGVDEPQDTGFCPVQADAEGGVHVFGQGGSAAGAAVGAFLTRASRLVFHLRAFAAILQGSFSGRFGFSWEEDSQQGIVYFD